MLKALDIALDTLNLTIINSDRDTANLKEVSMESAMSAIEYPLIVTVDINTINNLLTLSMEEEEAMMIPTARSMTTASIIDSAMSNSKTMDIARSETPIMIPILNRKSLMTLTAESSKRYTAIALSITQSMAMARSKSITMAKNNTLMTPTAGQLFKATARSMRLLMVMESQRKSSNSAMVGEIIIRSMTMVMIRIHPHLLQIMIPTPIILTMITTTTSIRKLIPMPKVDMAILVQPKSLETSRST